MANEEHSAKSEQSAFGIRSAKQKAKSDIKKSVQVNNQQLINGKRTVNCWNCGRSGHKAVKCRQRKGEHRESENLNTEKSFSVFCSTVQLGELPKNMWCLDSGATAHLCGERSMFKSFREHKERILLAGNKYIMADGRGTVKIAWRNSSFELIDVLFVKNLQCNFMSVSKAIENGFRVSFENRRGILKNDKNKVVLIAELQSDLFMFQNERKVESACFVAQTNLMRKWHQRFGHLNFASLNKMIKKWYSD